MSQGLDRMWSGLKTPYEPDGRLAKLTPGQRAVYALSWVDAEVTNGGFDQLFRNSTGYLMPEALQGAVLLGADDYSAVFHRASAIFPRGVVPRDRAVRTTELDADPRRRDVVLGRADDDYYALLDDPHRNLTKLLAAYMTAHPDDFYE